MSAQTLKIEEVQLDSIVNELCELGAQQNPKEIDLITDGFDADSISINLDWPIVYINSVEEVDYGDYKKDEIWGAIKFAEEFIGRIYMRQVNLGMPSMVFYFAQILLNYDLSGYQNIVMEVLRRHPHLKCGFVGMTNENILGFDRIDVLFYPYPFRSYQPPLCIEVLYEIATGEYSILTLRYDFEADKAIEKNATSESSSNEGIYAEEITVAEAEEDNYNAPTQVTLSADDLTQARQTAKNYVDASLRGDYDTMMMNQSPFLTEWIEQYGGKDYILGEDAGDLYGMRQSLSSGFYPLERDNLAFILNDDGWAEIGAPQGTTVARFYFEMRKGKDNSEVAPGNSNVELDMIKVNGKWLIIRVK